MNISGNFPYPVSSGDEVNPAAGESCQAMGIGGMSNDSSVDLEVRQVQTDRTSSSQVAQPGTWCSVEEVGRMTYLPAVRRHATHLPVVRKRRMRNERWGSLSCSVSRKGAGAALSLLYPFMTATSLSEASFAFNLPVSG